MSEATESIIDELIDGKPEPSIQIIERIEEKEREEIDEDEPTKTASNESTGNTPIDIPAYVPSDDTVFDPTIHVVDDNGNPRRTKTGKFRKKPGRKNGSIHAAVMDAGVNPREAEAAALAAALVSTMFIFGTAIGGEEWQPIRKPEIGLDEPQQLTDAWKAYFMAAGDIRMPIWAGPAIATVAYAAPRFTMPKTQSRFKTFCGWFKGKFKKGK